MQNKYLTVDGLESLVLSQKKVFNVEELSAYTGLSKSCIYKLTGARRIPFSRPNNKLIFFDRVLVDEFLLSNPISPVDDIEQEAINYVSRKTWKELGK